MPATLAARRTVETCPGSKRATVQLVHDLALSMPGVTVEQAGKNPVYQVGRKSFVFFRNPRPDAFDAETGERYDDVIVFWVADDVDKQALVEDESTPFFTTPHFDGHPSVLLRGSRVGELTADELTEVVYDAWLARAGKRARAVVAGRPRPGLIEAAGRGGPSRPVTRPGEWTGRRLPGSPREAIDTGSGWG